MPFAKLKELYKEDGVDHIRIYHSGKTELGRLLAVDSKVPFEVEGAGSFGSAKCFINWLWTGDEALRYKHNHRLKDHIPNYQHYLLYAKYLQVKSNVEILEKDYSEDKRLLMYRIHDTGVREIYNWKGYVTRISRLVKHILAEQAGQESDYRWIDSVDEKVKNRIIEIGNLYKQQSTEESQEEVTVNEEAEHVEENENV